MISALTPPQRLKLEVLERGISVDESAVSALTAGGSRPLVEHDYVTTGGLTIVLNGDIYVNAPVDYAFVETPAARLVVADGAFALESDRGRFDVRVLPLPGYLLPKDKAPHGIMTHADRVRISPIDGCACSCRFCDWPLMPYAILEVDELMEGLRTAMSDTALPPRHVLVSGGTPRLDDRAYMDEVYMSTIAASPVPVDVMLMPRDGHAFVERLVKAGVSGFSINIEVFDRQIAKALCPNKEHVGLDGYAEFISFAVESVGGRAAGRVRSSLLLGLEPLESTLEGVRLLAGLGCDIVLSPFRPAEGTELASTPTPSADLMEQAFVEARAIAREHGVVIGPRCIPCQHNTIAFPDGDAFYYS